MCVTLSKLKVLQLFKNLILAFDYWFKLFIFGSDLVLQRGDHFICLLFDGLLKLSELAVESLEVGLEFLKDTSCFLSDNTIDWGLKAYDSLWEEGLDACIFPPVDDLSLNLNDRFKHFFYPLWRLLLFSCLDVACSQSFGACGMNYFDRVCTKTFRDVCWHIVLFYEALIGDK